MIRLLPLGLVLLAGTLLRAGYLLAPHIDSDQAIFGLTAMRVLQGEFPIFQWGYHYLGTLQTYLDAVFFAVFGPSREVLNAVPVLLSAVFIWVTYLLGKELAGRKTGFWAALFAALGPYALVIHGAWARHGYLETLLFGSLLLLLTARLVYREPGSIRKADGYLAWGFVAGVAWWTNFLILYYLLPCALFLWARDKKLPLRPEFLKLLLAFFIGSLPFWIYNFTHGFASFEMLRSSAPDVPLWEKTAALAVDKLPEILGAREGQNLFGKILALASAAAAFGWLLTRRQPRAFALPAAFAGGLLAIFLVSRFSAFGTIRYLLPLYSVLPVFFGRAVATLLEKNRAAGGVLAAAILAANLWDNALNLPWLHRETIARYREDRATKQKMAATLLEKKIGGAYCPHYWVGPLLTFDVAEKLVFPHPYLDRYPLYARRVDALWNPAFLTVGGDPELEKIFKSLNVRAAKEDVAPFQFYTRFQRVGVEAEEIPAQDWKAAASHDAEKAGFAFDRNLRSVWITSSAQTPGMTFTVELPEEEPLCQIELHLGSARRGAPAQMEVELSADALNWKKIQHVPRRWGYFWSEVHPFHHGHFGPMEISFQPMPARFVRFTLREPHADGHYWALAEIALYRSLGTRYERVLREDVKELAATLEKLPPHRIYAGVWLSAHLQEYFPKLSRVAGVWRAPVDEKGFAERQIDFSAPVCLVATDENRGAIARTLEEYRMPHRTLGTGWYTLFLLPRGAGDKNWVWNGKQLWRWKRVDKP